MRPVEIVTTLTAVLLLGSCSSTPREPTLHLLRVQPRSGEAQLESPLRISLGRIAVAPYLLSSAGIVIETAEGEVRAARHDQWAEPLDAGLRWFLRDAISRELGDGEAGFVTRAAWNYAVDVYVARLHGTMSGDALLEASYTIQPSTGEALEYRFSKSERLAQEGYRALVAAEQHLLTELARSIASALREQPEAKP